MFEAVDSNSDRIEDNTLIKYTDEQLFEILKDVNLSDFVKNNTEKWKSRLNKIIQNDSKVKEALIFIISNYKKRRKNNPENFGYMHCIEAASLMTEHWFTNPDEVAAALLHDVWEDIPNWEEYLKSNYNKNVVRLVKSLTEKDKSGDSLEQKRLTREQRKMEEMRKVSQFSPSELALKLADQISNIAETVDDLETILPEDRQKYWELYNAGYDKQIWKYETLNHIIEKRIRICKDENLFQSEDEEISLKLFSDKFRYLVDKLKWLSPFTE